MDWTQFTTFMIANIVFTLTLWLWNRAESRNDMRAMLTLVTAIQSEMKDFHGRLCAIDEKSRAWEKK